jgi:type I restriction enzyme S subunit
VAPGYLFAFLNTKFGQDQIARYARPTGQYNLNLHEVGHICIPLLPAHEQQAIEELLLSSAKAQEASTAYYAQAKALLEVELRLNTLALQKQVGYMAQLSDLATSRRADAEYYSPEARAIVRRITALQHTTVRESFDIGSGFPWNSTKFLPDNSGEPVVRIRNIKPNHIIPDELTSIVPSYANSLGVLKARKGDVVVGMDGIKYFYASLLEGQSFVNQRVCHLSPRASSTISPEYTVFMINSIIGQAQLMRDMTVATTVGHITNRDVANLVVPTISRSFHDKVTGLIRQSIDSKEESKRMLEQAKARVEQLIEEAIEP